MALRLRRGTDSERQLITPVEGELIYTTDTKLLYAGDGSTVGGTLVTGGGAGGSTTLNALTDTNLSGATQNDVLSYNSGNSKWEPVAVGGLNALELDNLTDVYLPGAAYNGDALMFDGAVWTARSVSDFFAEQQNYKINIVGDDSTIMIDTDDLSITGSSINGNSFNGINFLASGEFSGNLKGSTKAAGGQVVINNGTDGTDAVFTGALVGNVTGNTAGIHTGNVTGDLTGATFGSHIGTVDGDLQGSVFADNSTLMVDGINSEIFANLVETNFVQAAGPTAITMSSGATGNTVILSGITSGNFGNETALTIDSSKGTLASPQDTIAGDVIGALKVRGLNNGSQVIGSIQQTFWDTSANFSETYPKSGVRLMANAGAGKGTLLLENGTPTGFNHMTLRSDGALEGPIFKMIVVANTTARDALITAPEAGMIVFVTDVTKFQGHDGSAWVNLN